MPFEDLMRNLRMNNIFGPTNPMQPQNPMQIQPQMQQPDPIMQYQPEHQMTDQMQQMISQFPTRNRPGALQKIAASIAGIGGGPQAADEFAYKPYYQNLQDWQSKFGPIEKGAAEERMQNVNMRQIAALLLRDRATQRGLDIKEQTEAEKERSALVKEDISGRRADAYIFDKEHPDWKPEHVSGQTLKYRNPKDPTQFFDTGLSDDHLSDADKINLQTRGRLSEIAAQGAEARKTEAVRETGRQADISARGAQARETKTTSNRAALAKDKQLSVGQDAAAYKLARQQHVQDNPSHAKFWDNTGVPTSDAESNDEYVSAVEDIRKRYNTIKARSGASPKQTITPTGPVKRTGTARVKAPDGRTGVWDFSHGDIPEGYVEIK